VTKEERDLLERLGTLFCADCGKAPRTDNWGLCKTCLIKLLKAVLLPLLDHPSPLVREGAILGLIQLNHDSEIYNILKTKTDPEHEPSPGVRSAAHEALLSYDE